MLRKFKISIDGTQYLVEMEEIGAPQPTAADDLRPRRPRPSPLLRHPLPRPRPPVPTSKRPPCPARSSISSSIPVTP